MRCEFSLVKVVPLVALALFGAMGFGVSMVYLCGMLLKEPAEEESDRRQDHDEHKEKVKKKSSMISKKETINFKFTKEPVKKNKFENQEREININQQIVTMRKHKKFDTFGVLSPKSNKGEQSIKLGKNSDTKANKSKNWFCFRSTKSKPAINKYKASDRKTKKPEKKITQASSEED